MLRSEIIDKLNTLVDREVEISIDNNSGTPRVFTTTFHIYEGGRTYEYGWTDPKTGYFVTYYPKDFKVLRDGSIQADPRSAVTTIIRPL